VIKKRSDAADSRKGKILQQARVGVTKTTSTDKLKAVTEQVAASATEGDGAINVG
jgi:hypothetical protein